MPCETPPLGTPQLDPLCNVDNVINSKLGEWADQVETWMGEAVSTMVRATSTAWIGITTPGVTNGDPTNNVASNSVGFLQEMTLWISGAILIVGFIWGMAKMAVTGEAEHGKEAVTGIFRYVIVWGIGVGTVGILVAVADELAAWIIDQSSEGGGFAAGMAQIITDTGGLGFILVIVFCVLGLMVTFFQIILLIWRGGALVVLTSGLGWAASMASLGDPGKAIFAKYCGWIVAYILYKPAAALFYAAAFKLMTAADYAYDDTKTIEHITGIALMFLALLALPAMIRLVAPAAAAVASGRGAGATLGAAASVALPMGAMAVAARGAGGAASGGAAAASAGGGGGGSSSNGGSPDGSVPPSGSTTPPPAPPSNGPKNGAKQQPAPV